MIAFSSLTPADLKPNTVPWVSALVAAAYESGIESLDWSALPRESIGGLTPLVLLAAAQVFPGAQETVIGIEELTEANSVLLLLLGTEAARVGLRWGLLAANQDTEGVKHRDIVQALGAAVACAATKRWYAELPPEELPVKEQRLGLAAAMAEAQSRAARIAARTWPRWREWVAARQELAETAAKEAAETGNQQVTAYLQMPEET